MRDPLVSRRTPPNFVPSFVKVLDSSVYACMRERNPLWLSTPATLTLRVGSVVGVCVHYHLLSRETSQRRSESCSNGWVQR